MKRITTVKRVIIRGNVLDCTTFFSTLRFLMKIYYSLLQEFVSSVRYTCSYKIHKNSLFVFICCIYLQLFINLQLKSLLSLIFVNRELANATREHFITQAGKNSKTTLKISWSRGAEGPRAEKNSYPNSTRQNSLFQIV